MIFSYVLNFGTSLNVYDFDWLFFILRCIHFCRYSFSIFYSLIFKLLHICKKSKSCCFFWQFATWISYSVFNSLPFCFFCSQDFHWFFFPHKFSIFSDIFNTRIFLFFHQNLKQHLPLFFIIDLPSSLLFSLFSILLLQLFPFCHF